MTLEHHDIQGIVLQGYGKLSAAAFVLLQVTDPARARKWLKGLSLRSAADSKFTTAQNVAFTCAGLAKLGLDAASIESFPSEFREGMVTEFRRRVLGDFGGSDPEKWAWGKPNDPDHEVDVLLMLYADSEPALEKLVASAKAAAKESGLKELKQLASEWLPELKEHFGFHDGISDVPIRGHRGRSHGVAPGEFLLGYENEYGKYTRSPESEQVDDLGRNGSYLVFRQLFQDVHGFWKWLDGQAEGRAAERVCLASKMVGRWPGGASLVHHPNAEPAHQQKPDNDFQYLEHDPHGERCPLGSHVRRTNPRDAFAEKPGDESLSNLHRIIRRGRAYGKPLAADMKPESMLAAGPDGIDRGLHFICFNANIERQFEFVQQTWSNSGKFASLRNDPDPLIGARYLPGSQFTVQEPGVRRRYVGMPDFVSVRGGAYFFMPGIAAVKALAAL